MKKILRPKILRPTWSPSWRHAAGLLLGAVSSLVECGRTSSCRHGHAVFDSNELDWLQGEGLIE
jgi:hypothetical protein